MTAAHAIEQAPRIADLVEPSALHDILRSWSELERVGVSLYDREGGLIADFAMGNAEYCGALFRPAATRKACGAIVASLGQIPVDDSPRVVSCFSGLEYRILPLHVQGDLMGRLVLGPFAAATLLGPGPEAYALAPELEPAVLDHGLAQVRRFDPATLEIAIRNLRATVETLLYVGYRGFLASALHVETTAAAYADLEEKTRELKLSHERLQELDRLKSNFLATVSHELRTPLTSIIGFAEMLAEEMAGPLNPDQRKCVATIMEKGESLLQLIRSILEISKVESGTLRVTREPTDVRQLVEACLHTVVPIAEKRHIAITPQVAAALPLVPIDYEKIQQVLWNLLTNAVKFSHEGGVIQVIVELTRATRRTRAEDRFADPMEEYLRLAVRDAGIGIPANEIERIFETFYQVDGSSTREYGGAGIGLSLVRSFVHAHDGTVNVESAPGKGSTFTVLIPIEM